MKTKHWLLILFFFVGVVAWGTTCVYHPATGRYLLNVSIHDDLGDWGLYESRRLWDP